jgi:hypothetical protein
MSTLQAEPPVSDPTTTTVTTAVASTTTTTVESDPHAVAPAWYWIKDAAGHGSITATMVFVAFWVTTLSFVASIFDKIGPVSIRPFDVGACSAYFIPVLTLYFGRKFTDAKILGKS